MQTAFTPEFLATADGQEADSILRSCVHCGFCTATCPTFLETGNELDSPRGRIYLIKTMLEGGKVSDITRTHLDRCLTCQSCETTCPSSVNYHGLLNIGRKVLEEKSRRPLLQRMKAWILRKGLTNAGLQQFGITMARRLRFFAPASVLKTLNRDHGNVTWSESTHQRKMLILNGCVQQQLSPDINAAASRVFSRLGISLTSTEEEGCCGALSYHLNAQEEGLAFARKRIDALCKQLDNGAEAIISTASGCGNFMDQYAKLFATDNAYALKAQRIQHQTKDIAAVLADEDLSPLALKQGQSLAFHCPCTLQHGLGQGQLTEDLLRQLGLELVAVKDSHLCCGSAGAYSVMEAEMSVALRKRKIKALTAENPQQIITANIGCQLHLAQGTDLPVTHWIVTLDKVLV